MRFKQSMQMPPPPLKAMQHVVGQIYHHYDFPLTEEDMLLRDQVYILSIWRTDSKIRYGEHGRNRLLRKYSQNEVHDIIKFHAPIDVKSAKALNQHLQYLNSIDYAITGTENKWIQPIWLEIMSPGGSVPSGIEMRSAVSSSRRPVIPIISGMCASAATFMFTANQKHRLMQEASILLIHQMSRGTEPGKVLKKVDWETETSNMETWEKQIEKFYLDLKRPTITTDLEAYHPDELERDKELYTAEIKKLMQGKDVYMDPEVALSWGLCTNMFKTWGDLEGEGQPGHYVRDGVKRQDEDAIAGYPRQLAEQILRQVKAEELLRVQQRSQWTNEE